MANGTKLISVDDTVISFSDEVKRNDLGRTNVKVNVRGSSAVGEASTGIDPKEASKQSSETEEKEFDSISDSLQDYARENMTTPNRGRRVTMPSSEGHNVLGVAGASSRTPTRASNEHSISSDTKTDPLKFSADVFYDRVMKFYSPRKKELEKVNKSGEEALKEYLKAPLISYFMSPRVKVDLDQLYFVVKDLIEFKSLEESPAFDNLMDLKGSYLGDSKKEEVTPDPLPHTRRQSENMFIPEKALKSNSEVLVEEPKPSSPNFDKAFGNGSVLKNFASFPDYTEKTFYPVASVLTEEVEILKPATFEQCKRFKCEKYGVFSLAEYSTSEKVNKMPTGVNSTLFKVCCPFFDKEGCPQSKVYSEQEQIIYDSALDTSGSEDVAHNVIVSMRIKLASS